MFTHLQKAMGCIVDRDGSLEDKPETHRITQVGKHLKDHQVQHGPACFLLKTRDLWVI